VELYHVDTDPTESRNIAADYPQVVEKLSRLLSDARSLPQRQPSK
jgi:hypothetical protein